MLSRLTVFTLALATTFSALAYPTIYSTSDNLPVEQEVTAIDARTTAEIYQEYFGSEENTEVPVISDELADRLLNGAWYNTPATDQGNSRQEILDQARSNKSNAVKTHRSSTSTGKSGSYASSSKTNSQLKRYRRQTKMERTRNRTVASVASRIKQSIRNRQFNTAKIKRQRDRSRGYLPGTKRRTAFSSTRRFRHTRSGTTPGS